MPRDQDGAEDLLNYEEIDEDVIINGLSKLVKIYNRAVEGKVRHLKNASPTNYPFLC